MKTRLTLMALCMVLLVGCQPASPTSPTLTVAPTTAAPTTVAPTTPAPVPSAEPTFEGEKQAIYEALRAFLGVEARASADPKSIGPIDVPKVAIGTAALALRNMVSTRLANNWKTTGTAVHMNFEVADATTQNGQTQSTVTYCTDLTGIGFVTLDGVERLEKPNRPMFLAQTMILQKMPNGKWIAATLTNKAAESC